MGFFRKPVIHLLWIFAIWCLPVTSYTVAGPVDGIHYDKITDALTVHVQEMPLGEVLQKIGVKSGIKFSIEADLNRPVTTDLTAVPLEKAIYSLVQPNSSAMIYSKKGDGAVVLSSVKIFDKGGAPPSSSENGYLGPSMRGGAGPADPRFTGAEGGGRTVREPAGNNRRTRSHRDAGKVLSDSDSQTGTAAGSPRSALESFTSGGIRRDR